MHPKLAHILTNNTQKNFMTYNVFHIFQHSNIYAYIFIYFNGLLIYQVHVYMSTNCFPALMLFTSILIVNK